MSRFLFLFALLLPLAACESADEPAVATDPDPGTMEVAADPGQVTDDGVGATPERLNVNTASAEQLATIPNVGDRMVHEFEEYRPYSSILQFRQEIGKYVDEDVVAGYEEHLFVPIAPNESDEETLMQIPGVDATMAASLVALRPFASDADFLAAVAEATGGAPDGASLYLAE